MDFLELWILLLECVVVGFGMAVGDWLVKVIAVKLLNSQQASLHDVEDDDEEEEKKKRTRQRKARPPAAGAGGGSVAVIP